MEQASEKPRKRNAELTRQRLLKAATKEFASKGFAGARVDKIAARANINKRMLYHYFGSKEGLFLAVLETAYGDIRSAEKKLDLDHLAPLDAINRIVDFTWNYYLRHPEFLTLINSANLYKARHLKKSKTLPDMHLGMLHMIAAILRRGAAEGVFRKDADPLQLVISIAALGYYYLTNRYTMAVIFGFNPMDAKALDRRRTEIKHTIIASLKP